MENKPNSAAEVTEAIIEAWKKQYPKGVHELTVGDKRGFIRNPTRNDVKYGLTRLKGGSELDMVEAMLEEMWLGGDKEILEEDEYFFGAVTQVQELIQVKEGALKKL